MSTTTSRLYPAAVGGFVMGVLSALPLIAAGNVCCCLWAITGGVVAAYLLQQNQVTPITAGEGAVVGLMAGVIGAVVEFVLSIPIGILVAPMERAIMERLLAVSGSMPPEMRDLLDSYLAQSADAGALDLIVRRLVALIFMLGAGAVFSTLGGLLGAAVFRKPSQPAVSGLPPPM